MIVELTELQVDRDAAGNVLNPRGKTFGTADLELTISAFGRVIYPIIVKDRNDKGLYPVRDGHRRIAALERLYAATKDPRWLEVEAIVCAEEGAALEAALMLAVNTSRIPLPPSRIGAVLVALSKSHGWNDDRIAAHTGLKAQDVLAYCDLAHASESVQRKVDSGDLSLTTFRRYLAKLPKAKQDELAGMKKPTGDAVKAKLREAAQEALGDRAVDDDTVLLEKLNSAEAAIREVLNAAPYSGLVAARIRHRLQSIAGLANEHQRAAQAA